jgi:RNA polymerase sigma factor (sigma-70 family)
VSSDFLQIIEQHQNIIHKVSRMYRDSREDQEDLFQEIVFQLWKGFSSFRGEAKISSWIYRIALNTSIAVFRKKKLPLDYKEHIPEEFHPSESHETSENEERMYWALRQLNNAEKAIISLYLEDYSYEEISSITGISESNVGVRLNRIKTKLKTILNT